MTQPTHRTTWIVTLALSGLAIAGCSSTSANGNDAGDDNGQDDTGSPDNDDAETADTGSTTPRVDDGGVDSTLPGIDGGSTDATVNGPDGSDAATTDASDGSVDASGGSVDASDGSVDASDGSVSCVGKLWSTYVQRTDGVLIWENQPSSPETIIDAATGVALAGIVSVQEGPYHGCAALSGGGVECWQTNASNGNTSGQLGNGTTTATSALYQATSVLTGPGTPLTNVVAVASGDDRSNNACAVTSDGKLWCWGDLTWIVNNGTTLHVGYAQAITTDGTTPLAGVSSAALGSAQACAIVAGSTNSVYCWGYNGDGELGLGSTANQQYPTKVLGLTSPTLLATTYNSGGWDTICALDGANVRCWGENAYGGAAGTNTTTSPILSPTAVVLESGTLLGDVADLEGGNNAFAVLRTDGTIWLWGGGQGYAANYGLTDVLRVGWAGPAGYNGPRYLTSDGVYHSAMTNVTVNCNAM
jgi:hypothetical protein